MAQEIIQKRLTSLAITSRILVLLLQFSSNIIIPDHNAQVFQFLRTESRGSWVSTFLNFTLGGFIRWDAEYFMHIAKYGYTFENSLAFFPLYPTLVRIFTEILIYLVPSLHLDTTLLLICILCNIVFFILTVNVFYRLSLLIFDETIAYRAAVLFCFNPASIFFTAPYTESLFCYLTFQSIYYSMLLLQKYSKPNNSFSVADIRVIFFISLSTLVRANGLLNIGFLIYTIFCIFITYFPKTISNRVRYIFKYVCIIFISFIICSLPFILYQVYCFKEFCTTHKVDLPVEIIHFASEQNFVLPGQFAKFNQSWCYQKIPLAYSYVQDHYWNVGFLRYYELKQIPNFLLATPCLYIVIKNCLVHLDVNFNKLKSIFDLNELVTYSQKKEKYFSKDFFKLGLTAFVVHALFLSVFSAFCIHVQVSTRMICSATPLFYWYCTYYYMNGKNNVIKLYFGSYVIVGTVMFCNFLPWT
ncbi:unnamed protein product [Psylliodes chrysocephalus]|uniref:GPI mannosyltransferase 2 n=1 Tax=Psylliodes chrysocephalus TaxID=3402493 RepID=A0A9P0D232_9CUCU|nr:unnamed protein product [Psylliodes chrysocephala]